MFGAHDLHSRTSLNNERATLGLRPPDIRGHPQGHEWPSV